MSFVRVLRHLIWFILVKVVGVVGTVVKTIINFVVDMKCSGTCVQGTLVTIFFEAHTPEGLVSRLLPEKSILGGMC